MSAPLRIAVVGAGAFGERHLAAYARQPGVELVGVADRDGGRAREVAARWGVPAAFDDAAALLAAVAPDAISVVTPGAHHVEPAVAALERGCSVLLEKPVATRGADVAAIVRSAERSAGVVVPAHILRFAKPYEALRERVRGGAIGRPLGIAARRDRTRAHAHDYADVHPALMTMIHDVDLALWVTGARARRVSAHQRGAQDGGPPLLVWATVEADDGTVWSLRVSWLLPQAAPPADRFEVHGDGGVATVELAPAVTVLAADGSGARGGERIEHVDHELTPETLAGAIDAEVAHFCTCARERRESPVVTLAGAAHGVAVAEAVVASAQAGGAWVDIARVERGGGVDTASAGRDGARADAASDERDGMESDVAR